MSKYSHHHITLCSVHCIYRPVERPCGDEFLCPWLAQHGAQCRGPVGHRVWPHCRHPALVRSTRHDGCFREGGQGEGGRQRWQRGWAPQGSSWPGEKTEKRKLLTAHNRTASSPKLQMEGGMEALRGKVTCPGHRGRSQVELGLGPCPPPDPCPPATHPSKETSPPPGSLLWSRLAVVSAIPVPVPWPGAYQAWP